VLFADEMNTAHHSGQFEHIRWNLKKKARVKLKNSLFTAT
jgi:hypothetical protein